MVFFLLVLFYFSIKHVSNKCNRVKWLNFFFNNLIEFRFSNFKKLFSVSHFHIHCFWFLFFLFMKHYTMKENKIPCMYKEECSQFITSKWSVISEILSSIIFKLTYFFLLFYALLLKFLSLGTSLLSSLLCFIMGLLCLLIYFFL